MPTRRIPQGAYSPSVEDKDLAKGCILRHLTAAGEFNRRDWGSEFTGQEEFVLAQARWFETDGCSTSGRRMAAKQCFCNSALRAFDDPNLRYCEGYCGYSDRLSVIHHAWLIDERAIVIDPTLRKTAFAYFGVPVQTEYLIKTMTRTKFYRIFIPQNEELYRLDDARLASVIDNGKPQPDVQNQF